jgi:glycosyltransferase involved in cell wall biosynthesis
MKPRRKVLVLAAVCHPDDGSEPGLGWNWATSIARYHDVTVITSDFRGGEAAIRSRLSRDAFLADRMRFVFVPWFEAPVSGISAFLWNYYQPLYYRAYRRWMKEALVVARKLLEDEGGFDLCHQLNMIGFREPGYLWQLEPPFVWGPVGGTQNVPWRMLPSLGIIEGGRHICRNVINEYQKRFDRRFLQALRKASAVISVASDTQNEFRRLHGIDSEVIAAAFCVANHPRARVRRPTGRLRLVYTGLHLSRKGLPFALEALAGLRRDTDWTLDVLGQGIMTEAWKAKARQLGIADRVTFHGFVSRESLIDILDASDVYVFPSLLEGWPASIAEALSLGLPVVTTDHHGMHDMVTSDCGILVNPRTPKQLVDGLTAALASLCEDRQLVTRLSEGALRRAVELGVDRQIPAVLATYEKALGAAAAGEAGRRQRSDNRRSGGPD